MTFDELLAELVHEFGAEWRRGTADICAFYTSARRKWSVLAEPAARRRLLQALVRMDLENCQRFHGSTSDQRAWRIEDYIQALPDLGPLRDVPVRVIAEEYRTRLAIGRRQPSWEEYKKRFPHHDARELKEALTKALVDAVVAEQVKPTLSGFSLDKRLGKGAFGVVYKGRHLEMDHPVAIKLLIARSNREKDVLKQFSDEAKLIATLNHPNIIRVYHAEVTGAIFPYLVLEYAAEGSLETRLDEYRRRAPNNGRSWQVKVGRGMHEIASGVGAAHEQSIVHRDLKPGNVLIAEDGKHKVADFGLALRSHSEDGRSAYVSGRPGTIFYSSPEQLAGMRLKPASDVYSLGVMLFELLMVGTGFQGQPGLVVDGQEKEGVTSPRSVNPQIHRDLDAICRKCLQRDPTQRYESANELAQDLKRFQDGWPVKARRASPWEFALAAARNGPIAATLSLLLLVVATTMWLLVRDRAELASTLDEQQVSLERQEESLETAVEENRLQEYAADLQAVEQSWRSGNVAQVRKLLARNVPAINGNQPDLRGFEWYYWDHVLKYSSIPIETSLSPVRHIAVDVDGERMAATDFRNVEVWNLRSRSREKKWKVIRKPPGNFFSQEMSRPSDTSVAFSPDGQWLAATGFVLRPGRSAALRVWNTSTGKLQLSVGGDAGLGGRAVTFSPDGRWVAAGCFDHGWRAWNLATKRERRHILGRGMVSPDRGHRGAVPVQRLTFSPDGRRLFTSCGGVIAWNWGDGKVDQQALTDEENRVGASVVHAWASDQTELAGLVDGKLRLYRRDGMARLALRPQATVREMIVDCPAPLICFDLRQGRLVAGGNDKIVYTWVLSQPKEPPLKTGVYPGSEGRISCVTMTPQGMPVCADHRGTVRVWTSYKPEVVVLPAGKNLSVQEGGAGPPTSGQGRLYRNRGTTIDICCSATLRRLLSVPIKPTDEEGQQLIAVAPTAGADGFAASETLDRRFAELVARWRQSEE